MLAKDIQHRTLKNMALPYVTLSSPTSTDPQFIAGSNVLSYGVYQSCQRRPGFPTGIEPTPRVFTGTISRIFQWRRWDDSGSGATRGVFVFMVCETTANSSKVYAFRKGVDTTFTLIYTATATDGIPFDFVVSNNSCFFGNGTTADMQAYDATTVYTWGITAPSAAPTVTITAPSSGSINMYSGYKWLYTYGDSSRGHESSPSSLSSCPAIFTAMQANISVTASTNPRVDQIRVYRTTDGGSQDSQDMLEISGSPFANTTATVVDVTTDANLSTRTAPEFLRNDPPIGLRGFIVHAGRIGGFKGNTFYYSGFEEIQNGVPEECWPSGLDGNNEPFDVEIASLCATDDGVNIFTAERIYKVEGDSLDTFRRFKLSEKQGCRNVKATTGMGSLAVWFDTSDTIFLMGGQEVGQYVRPTLAGVDQSKVQLALHVDANFRWLCVLDPTSGSLLVFDAEAQQWNVPWPVSGTAIASCETSVGNYNLLIGHTSGKVLAMSTSSFNDNGVAYSAYVQSNLFDISPESKPEWRGTLDFISIKRNTKEPSDVSVVFDDDPFFATAVSIRSGKQDVPLRTQGTYLQETQYPEMPSGQTASQIAFRLDWPAEDSLFKAYQLDIGYHSVGL